VAKAKPYRHHVLDIYGVHLYLATTPDAWKKLRRRVNYLGDVPESLGLTTFATWHPDDGSAPTPILTIWIDLEHHDPIDLVETAAHEASHAAGQILHWLGHDYRGAGGTDEPHAYLVGWLTRWIFEGCSTT